MLSPRFVTLEGLNFELLVYGLYHDFAILVRPLVLLLVYAYYFVLPLSESMRLFCIPFAISPNFVQPMIDQNCC
jgi:hypothetical protein